MIKGRLWRLDRRLLGFAGLLLLALAACGPNSSDPKSKEQVLLDRAIAALWGDVPADAVKSLRTQSTLVEKNDGFSSTFELETLVGPVGQYRETRVWKDFGLREVFAATPERTWYLVDGTPVETDGIEEGPGREQLWLFEISKLAILKDGKRFGLKHEGKQTLDDGTEVERLRVKDHEHGDLSLALDIATADGLVHRAVLDDGRGRHSFSIVLGDYRKVEGIQFAHTIVSRLDGKHFATQTVKEIEINPVLPADAFVAPTEEKPLDVVTKDSIGGWLAWHRLDDEVEDDLPALKEWIIENGLEVAGPIIVLTGRPDAANPEATGDRLALAVKRPDAELFAKIAASEDFGLFEMSPRRSLCITVVGEEQLASARKTLLTRAATASATPLEVYFSRDGRIRQLQLPLD